VGGDPVYILVSNALWYVRMCLARIGNIGWHPAKISDK